MSIEVEHVSKTYGDHQALRDVTLTVPDGELTALLGPSGSGKTTLLRVIAGLEPPDAREGTAIRFAERDVARQRVAERRVGFVFQHYALFRHLSVFENIAFGLRVRPRRTRPAEAAIREKVNDLLALIQLDGLGHRYPEELSGGQRQRVALARALAVEPQVLLLDEPFGALDAKVRQELRRWLRRLHDTIHVTSLFVTHDQDEALEVADRVVVMNAGQIEQEGTPDEVFHQPANAFVTDFLGHVNLFHGRVEHGQAVFGSLRVDAPVDDAPEGQPARLFVRPHELELQRVPAADGAILARVVHVHSAGPQVRVELVTESGEEFQAELTHERFAEMPLRRGDHAYVSLRDHRVFVEDYII